ncbi:hypothetical protein NE237_020935 [Protea cynaroides]|uniref:Protein SDA1 n=1 Tax=Protea cynaroides TaxID=273540 RepID=A0A9Q0K3W5_9MAGN|nr:hypothetical protein NE237_020935 [Protea cynaroides]
MSLPSLQTKMKCDPEGYESELLLLYHHFDSSLQLFKQQAALNFTSIGGVGIDLTVAKDVSDMVMSLTHVTPFYPNHLSEFPNLPADLLRSTALLLVLFHRFSAAMLCKHLFFSSTVSIRHMNQKHKNEAKNRKLQNILFALLQVKMMMLKPHQRDVTELLAAAIDACHDMVPPDAVEQLFRQIVNQFVHDRSRIEAIAVGLNVVREMCVHIPLKSHEKAVSSAARSLITLFREICPSLIVKKERGCPIDPNARPNALGENERSCRALKRLAGAKVEHISSDLADVILSNEDFQKIKQLKAKEEAKIVLMEHGLLRKGSDAKSATFKIPSSEQLSIKGVDPSKLEEKVRRKLSKEEKLALVRAGREDRGKYQARTAVKQKKAGPGPAQGISGGALRTGGLK